MNRFLVILLFLCPLLFCSPSQGKRKEKRSVVQIETSMGNITVALSDDTPIHRDNFLKLVRQGFYDGTLFHRTIRDFMIQAGDPDSKTAQPGQLLGDGDLEYSLPPEFRLPYLYHWRGTLAAARESDDVNPDMRSSACQFYIVWGRKFGPASIRKVREQLAADDIEMTPIMRDDYEMKGGAPHLDGKYTVFGEVIEGLDIVQKIQDVQTDSNDRPLQDIRITRATVIQYSKEAKKHGKK